MKMEDSMAMDLGLGARLIQFGHTALERHYGSFTPLRGKGIRKGKRVAIRDGGKELICAIKLSTGGRIHFPREGDRWKTLSEVDRVLYLRPMPGAPGEVEAHMYTQDALLERFEENYAAALARGEPHLPIWLSADFEEGERFIGSGFGKLALWREMSAADSKTKQTSLAPQTGTLIQDAKTALARALGIKPENIQILIRA
jgi:hypothetical protein